MTSNMISDELLDVVLGIVNDPDHPENDLTREEALRTIVAWQSILDAEPTGTTKRNSTTNEIATRVQDPLQGPCWRILSLDTGTVFTDLRPTLGSEWSPVEL